MTSEEIKKAMQEFSPVRCKGIEYKRITAYIYRAIETHKRGVFKIVMQCELLDYNGYSVTIVEADKVELIKDEHIKTD